MGSTAGDVQRWLKQKVMFDQATITCRMLAKELGCGTSAAREHLEKFYGSEDAARLQVKATYLVFGRDRNSVADCLASLRVELAEEAELTIVKAKIDLVSCVELHSVKATQAPDPNLLRSEREAIILKQVPTTTPKQKTKLDFGNSLETGDAGLQATDSTTSPPRSQPNAKSAVGKPNSSIASKFNKSKSHSDKATGAASPSSRKTKSSAIKNVDKQPNTSKATTDKRTTSKATTKGKSVLEKQTDKEALADKEDVAKDAEESCSPINQKTKRLAQEEEDPTPSTRRRVTKTRIVQKTKVVRVKDKKGYRVNKEEVEEVEETYTDFESEPDDQARGGPRKKPRKTSDHSEKKVSELSKSNKSPEDKKQVSGLSRSESHLKDGAVVQPNKSKADGGKKNTSKDQSNITK
ncbi:hypothetical protein CROQUDRAFT_138617 [Cronartium quercuum f. sp. fusiforme G11]|uniref:DNA polymerase delta subunit 3 n=1 Tax=Cronartium quercuum f. sp. fusiforme G11 TaxID=708437 RepID=A0A9P6NZG3_9BASI|nr:hypothetical protein CROQUDRAFT_138617 [Cronartium quercuum f. sp. fusiforme G11]